MTRVTSVLRHNAARLALAFSLLPALAGCGGGSASGGTDISPAPTVTLSTSAAQVNSGDTATLTWSSTNATSCTASGGWSGGKATSGTEALPPITASATYTLTCTGEGGDASRAVTIDVNGTSGPTLVFSASPETVAFNTASQLTWTAQNVDTCEASGAWSGQKVLDGTATTGPLVATSEFTLTCEGAAGSVTRSVTVSVAAPNQPVLNFNVSPTTVQPNGSATLSWSSSNADSCESAGDWAGPRPLNGMLSTGPLTQPSTYALTCSNATGSVTRTVTVDVSGSNANALVTAFTLDDDGSGAGRPVTIGVPLAEGLVASGEDLVVTQTDGTVLTSQWSPLATWRTDGSQLHGALTFLTPDAGSASGSYEIRTGTAASGSPVTKVDVVTSGFDADVQVVTGGVTYNLSARDLLAGTIAPRLNHTHFAGPIASEYVVGGPLRVNGSGDEHPTLQAYFHIRAYDRPVERVYVTTVLENTGVFNTLADITGDVTISVGGTVQYTGPGTTIGADKRYPKRFWWNGDPEVWAQLDGEYVQDTRLVPEYREVNIASATLNAFPTNVEWNERGQLAANMSAGGAAPHLAPLDRWSTSYLMSSDRRAFDGMRAHGDAYHWVVSKNSYAMNPRDENTGFPLDLADNANLIGSSWGGANAIPARRQSTSPMQTDMAHQPSCNYVLYLVTADYSALEQCQMWGVANWIMERPGSYTGWPRSFYVGQVRAVGWGFRNILLAATATPDAHPLKDTLTDAVGFAIDSFAADARPLDTQGGLGLWLTAGGANAIIYDFDATPNPNDTGVDTGFSPWQDDFLTWSMGFSYQLGYANELNASAVWDWKSQAIVERLGDGTVFCWSSSASFAMGIRDDVNSALYPDWATIFDNNFPDAGTCPDNGDDDAGTDRSATDYGAQMGPAISVAVSTGIPGAEAAWTRYDERDVNWGDNTFETRPEWALKPADPPDGNGAPAAQLDFESSDTFVNNGASVTLTWTATDATSCTASGGWSGPKPLSGSETVGPLLQNADFTLSCDGPGGGVARTVSVLVSPAPTPTVTLNASSTNITAGQTVDLTWTSTDATSCMAFGDWTGAVATSGSQSVGPLSANASFILECTGNGGSATDSVSVTVTTPPPALSFSATPTEVMAGEGATLTWASQNAANCLASGDWTNFRPLNGSVLTGALSSTATYVLTCSGPGGPPVERSVTVTVTPPPDAPAVNLTASPSTVAQNGSATLSWTTQDANSCTASGAWSGSRGLSGSESTGALTATSTYTLTCTGPGGSASDSFTVTVATPPSLTLSASPQTINEGESTTLSWSTISADTCTASGDWSGSRGTSGSVSTGALSADSEFSLTCTGPGGSVTETVDVTVNATPTLTFSASPSTVNEGGSSTLIWSANNVTSCQATGDWSGSRSTSGSESTGALTATSDYTLSCSGPGGSVSETVTVNVTSTPEPTLSFIASPASIVTGESATLDWSTTNATSCTASGGWSGSRGTSGSTSTGALSATTSFTLSCTGQGGSVSDTVTVTVNEVPTLSFSATPSSVSQGQSATLNWSATDATSCTASGDWAGLRGTSGSESTGALTATSDYTLSCDGPGGSVTETVTVTVTAAPTLSLTATPATIDSGQSSQLNWSSTDATSCTASGAWSGSRGTSGSESSGALTATSDYTLSCDGPGGSVTETVTVTVTAAPTLSLTATPATIDSGQSSQLNWSSTDATSCTASGAWSGSRGTSGSESSGALTSTSTYTLECTGAGGSVTESVTVTVNSASAPTLSFSGSPTTVMSGDASTLNWNSTDADTCVASGAWTGNKPLSGSESTGALTSGATYTLTCSGASGSASESVTISVDSGSGGSVITSFTLDDSGTGAGRAVTLGMPLGEGVVGASTDLVVTRSDGTVLTSQWNKLTSWRTDNSSLHGALTFLTPDAGDNSGTYQVRTGTPSGGTAISKANIVSAGFDAAVDVSVGGTSYRLSAADLLSGAVSARQDYTHFAGPLAAEYVVGGPLRVNGTGSAHPSLQAYFHVRAFKQPVERVYVTAVLENTGVFTAASNVTGDVSITVGGVEQYSNNGFQVDADKRYPKRYWWNGDPGVWVQHDGEYIQDTKLVPEYREITVSESVLNGFPSSVEWDTRGQLSENMASGGAAAHLAPFDRWSAAYLVSGDRRAFDGMRAHGDAYHWVVSRLTYAMNPRDENTGFALNLANNSNLIGNSWGGANAMPARRLDTSPMRTDIAHQPSCNYVLYLATAEYGALEHCQLWGVANWVMERPGSNPTWPRSYFVGQVRSVGWGLRNMVLAATATPDAHPLKSTLDDAVTFAIDSFENDARALDTSDGLGLWLTSGGANAIIYDFDTTPNPSDSGVDTGFSPWQDDFLTWSMGFAHQVGYAAELDANGTWAWKAQAIVERLGNGSSFCWEGGASFAMGIRNTSGGALFGSWTDIYNNNFPSAGACGSNGAFTQNADRSATDYGANMGPAIAVATATGISNAAAAWTRYDTRSTNWGANTYETFPEWAIKP